VEAERREQPVSIDGDRLRELLDALIDSTNNSSTALDILVAKLAALFDCAVATIDLVGAVPGVGLAQLRVGLGDETVDAPVDPDGVRTAVETNLPVLLDPNHPMPPLLAERGVHAGVCLPFADTRSVLSVYRTSERAFSPSEVTLIYLMGRYLNALLRRVQRLSQLAQLAEHSLQIGACRSEPEVFERAVDGVRTLLHADASAVASVTGEVVRFTVQRGLTATVAAWRGSLDPIIASAVRNRNVVRVRDIRAGYPERSQWPIRASMIAPLEVDGVVVALLGAHRYSDIEFTADDEDVLTLLAGQVASAIANARLVATVERRRYTADILRDVSTSLNASLSAAVVAGRFCAAALEHSDAARVALLLFDEDGNRLVPTSSQPADDEHSLLRLWKPAHTLGIGDISFIAEALRERNTVVHREGTEDEPSAWLIAEPLAMHDNVVGVLLLEWVTVSRPPQPRLLRPIVELAVRALEQARVFERAERSGLQLAALHDVAMATNNDNDVASTLDRVVESTRQLTGAQVARIGLVDDNAESFTNVAIAGDSPILRGAQGSMSHSVGAWSIRHGQTVWMPDAAGGVSAPLEAAAWTHDHSPGSAVAVPMRGRGGVAIGFLTLRHPEPYFLTRSCIPILERFATEAALAVENYREFDARKSLERRLRQQATHDPLTGLINRPRLLQLISEALGYAARGRATSAPAVLFLDLDRFKTVNDSLGHAAGDELLNAVGERLREAVRPGDVVGRLGGDEFVVLLERLPRSRAAVEAELVAEGILLALTEPILVRGRPLVVSASIGLTVASGDIRDANDLLRDADIAMYRAKAAGKSQVVAFEPSMSVEGLLDMESDLRRALDEGGLQVYYQPIVELDTGMVRGVEALTRWHHPTLGAVPPTDFIALAEEIGLVRRLDQWVLDTALHDLHQLHARWPELELNVNVSAVHLHEPALPGRIADSLQRLSVRPELLTVEITETAAMWDPTRTMDSLVALGEMGIGAVLDDFGTGYSNFGQLKRFPLRGLKIDRSFVEHLDSDPQDEAIVAALITLSTSLGLGVTAEGVETRQQQQHLLALGCRRAQGYLFSAAVPVTELAELLAAQH
jgi:diguanylate cyclase (GGDEF)-like protein